ncbi:C40 family peptidase [Megasphaera sueciensis]|uniref:C40 family peptidase n=1 Tax=Megasphaera sueciensis TaxID=349094 RepID=UPI003D018352
MFKYDDLVGLPFRNGGRDGHGYDCWGLAVELFRRQGIVLKDYVCSSEATQDVACYMADGRQEWKKLDHSISGCLVVIRLLDTGWANHCGIYIGNGKFIHAYSEQTGVVIDRIKRWGPRIVGYYWPTEAAYET